MLARTSHHRHKAGKSTQGANRPVVPWPGVGFAAPAPGSFRLTVIANVNANADVLVTANGHVGVSLSGRVLMNAGADSWCEEAERRGAAVRVRVGESCLCAGAQAPAAAR